MKSISEKSVFTATYACGHVEESEPLKQLDVGSEPVERHLRVQVQTTDAVLSEDEVH